MTAAEPRVPGTLEEMLSPVWLTEALERPFPGIRVRAVTPGPVVSRVATNAVHLSARYPSRILLPPMSGTARKPGKKANRTARVAASK